MPEAAARVHAGTAPGGVRTFSGQPGFLRRAWGPGWALVGDAGYWKDPLTAHGLTDALRDAELLSRAIISSRRGEISEAAALASFQRTRDRLSLPLFEATDAIASQRWTDASIGALLLQVSVAMADEVDVLADLDGSHRGQPVADLSFRNGRFGPVGKDSSRSQGALGTVARVLLLVRHGETVANRQGHLLGRADPELSPVGWEQARALAGSAAACRSWS